jgi:hypothetical protein
MELPFHRNKQAKLPWIVLELGVLDDFFFEKEVFPVSIDQSIRESRFCPNVRVTSFLLLLNMAFVTPASVFPFFAFSSTFFLHCVFNGACAYIPADSYWSLRSGVQC